MDRFRVKPGTRVRLDDWDPNENSAFPISKEEAKTHLKELNKQLEELQELLYAGQKNKVLIVLQAMDTGGKDGTIRHVFDGVNPQGVRVACFKKPTPEELAHDYLWRVHKHVPGCGEIIIFNRSHYEDVLVVRVKNLVPEQTWSRRYEQINNFERMLTDEGTTIIKFFLYIDRDEQKMRLQSRLDNPKKHWKFNPLDLEDRKLWNKFEKAYEDALSKTSTEWAPWYIIPANRKWYRSLIVGTIIVTKLNELNLRYPTVSFDPGKIVIE